MKKRLGKIKWIGAILLALFCLFAFILGGGCRLDKEASNGKVQFSLSLMEAARAYTEEDVLAMAAGFVVTIVDSADDPVYEDEFLGIYTVGGTKYPITTPLALDVGDYNLTRFDIVDGSSTIIFSTPLDGSPFAGYVLDPLPIAFSIAKDAVTKVVPEVLATDDSDPEDFGYATFSFEVVNIFDFYIACFVYNEGINDFQLTDAQLQVEGDSILILDIPLDALTNRVYVSEDYADYTLLVDKAGYQQWSASYTQAELNNDCAENCPVIVILEEGATEPPPSETPTPDVSTPPPTTPPPLCYFYLLPETQTETAGSTFTVDLMANTNLQEMAAYDVTIGYDPTILALDLVENSTDADDADFILTVGYNASDAQITAFAIMGSLPAGHVHLATLTFTAVGTGTSMLEFLAIGAATDVAINPICPLTIVGYPAEVIIE